MYIQIKYIDIKWVFIYRRIKYIDLIMTYHEKTNKVHISNNDHLCTDKLINIYRSKMTIYVQRSKMSIYVQTN